MSENDSLRSDLVNALARSLVGPRGGPHEVLPRGRDPRDEYIMGVLAPIIAPSVSQQTFRDVDAEAELLNDGTDDDEEEAPASTTPGSTSFSPSLDPRAQPHSMGVSFAIEPCGAGKVRVAVTYARYGQRDDGQWERQPFWRLFEFDPLIPTGGDSCPSEVSIRYWSREVPGHPQCRRVSVFLVNGSVHAVPERPPATNLLVFQPQIRVVLPAKMTLESVLVTSAWHDPSDPERHEEESLALLYHDRPILARGHMCSTTWKGMDPEATAGGSFPPLDLDSLPVGERARFGAPDVRTVYMPMVPVASPVMSWDSGLYPTAPELDPRVLSQLWDPERLAVALTPLHQAYTKWVSGLGAETKDLPPALRGAAERHVALCKTLADRIDFGITLLRSDSEIRLAFCFANQAMAVQASWSQKKHMEWRPFQLAFMILCLRGIANPLDPDRQICELLWFPTGGGKTEAYLGLAAFTLGLRRLRSQRDTANRRTGDGVSVLSRYTLRLLTIQQFRRALRMVLACEMLRVKASQRAAGWRPDLCDIKDDYLWGTHRFSAGLWVGGGVTPNKLEDIGWPDVIPGALSLLSGSDNSGHGEPAQVPRCPACDVHLAVPQPRYERQERAAFPAEEEVTLYFVVFVEGPVPALSTATLSNDRLRVEEVEWLPLPAPDCHTMRVRFTAIGDGVSAREVDDWWTGRVLKALPAWSRVESTRASRPGYFLRTYQTQQNNQKSFDFEIYCPNPGCPTAMDWREGVPVSLANDPSGWQEVIPCFRSANGTTTGIRVPIPALTVDDQIYSRPPSLVVATVDKFARLAYEPRAATMFGAVEHYHARHGYYRAGAPGGGAKRGEDHPAVPKLSTPVPCFPPPDLILQDELHLIDGPLGSMVGLYESAIDLLCQTDERPAGPKYIASTATVREAESQINSLFARKLAQFPAAGIRSTDNFFARIEKESCEDSKRPGRLYLGVCAPGKGAQTPIVRIWSVLLQAVEEARLAGQHVDQVDNFWTLVGYFNAVRELAGAMGLYRQDISQRIRDEAGPSARDLKEPLELSSRADALQLPSLLSLLEKPYPEVDAVLATSMFGTGVDVERLGLMVMHGQPKTTSSYIQATGRVGRKSGGLVISFLRASRPRDLDHYEFFSGYHRQIYRAVEPVTVSPFSPRARDRALGPICVVLLRQSRTIDAKNVNIAWRVEQLDSGGSRSGSRRMATARGSEEVEALTRVLELRAGLQPLSRRPAPDLVRMEVASELDRWKKIAQLPGLLLYNEYAIAKDPTHPVVLGDAQHQQRQLDVAFEDAPTSLRDVEATTGFKV